MTYIRSRFSDSDTSVEKVKGEEGVVYVYFLCAHMAEKSYNTGLRVVHSS